MKLLITGGTGFVGRHLVPRLVERSHELVMLTRDPLSARKGLSYPIAFFPWPGYEADPPREALDGIDGVIHLAGEPLVASRWNAGVKQRILDSRVLGTRSLMRAIKSQSQPAPKFVISASAVGYYGSRGETVLTEESSPGTDFLAQVCRQWEGAVIGNLPEGSRPVVIRTGMVLGVGGGALARLRPIYRAGLGGPLGNGRQWMSWIHVSDLVSLILHALETPSLLGAVNAVAPNPVQNREFNRTLGRVLHRPAWLPVPAPVLRLTLGEMASVLLASQRVHPKKALGSGFQFRFPQLGDALADLLHPQ